MHEANRRHWDAAAQHWELLRDQDQLWRAVSHRPDLAFGGRALTFIREFVGELEGKRVCVIGSGDNYAAFALAGMGADVTSTDISAAQLEVAANRAARLGLEINFARADAADLMPIDNTEFDLVCSTNGFFVWISEPARVFAAVARVLKSGGHYIFYDIHPFMRPWKDQPRTIQMEKSYFETGPFVSGEPDTPTYEFHWTMADLLNGLASANLMLLRIAETQAEDSRFWQDFTYLAGTDKRLLDWRRNPRAGFPVWLTVAARKPEACSSQTLDEASASDDPAEVG